MVAALLTTVGVGFAVITRSEDVADTAVDEPVEEQTTSPETSASPPTTAAPIAGAFPVVSEWMWTVETTDGYRTSGQLTVGAVSRADDAPSLPGLESPASDLVGTCSGFDADTDALVPAKISLTNDTTGFARALSSTFYLFDRTESFGAVNDGPLSVAAIYTSGTECAPIVNSNDAFFSEGNGWGLSYADEVEPGTTVGPHYAMLILPAFYTPAQPDGDWSRLDGVGLALIPAMSKDGGEVVAMTGPDSEFQATGGAFAFTSLR